DAVSFADIPIYRKISVIEEERKRALEIRHRGFGSTRPPSFSESICPAEPRRTDLFHAPPSGA
ncbi:MAG: hypothetical protein QF473_38630, partial [Planctomycetota bacterium]|nr:hypothetical protein [Planctomycetota bacterium]